MAKLALENCMWVNLPVDFLGNDLSSEVLESLQTWPRQAFSEAINSQKYYLAICIAFTVYQKFFTSSQEDEQTIIRRNNMRFSFSRWCDVLLENAQYDELMDYLTKTMDLLQDHPQEIIHCKKTFAESVGLYVKSLIKTQPDLAKAAQEIMILAGALDMQVWDE